MSFCQVPKILWDQTDKKTGIKYAYESISYWDKEKKQPRSTGKYLGRVDEETGEIYIAENSLRDMSADERLKERQRIVRPKVDAFFEFIHSLIGPGMVLSERLKYVQNISCQPAIRIINQFQRKEGGCLCHQLQKYPVAIP